jgi:hypothetical protein
MTRVFRGFSRLSIVALLGAMLALAGCNGQSVKSKMQAEQMAKGFKTVVKSYKSGQFTLDGAVLSQEDLSSHFAYLRDQGRLPKRVLLLRSDKTKIHKAHLQAMARMALDYGFTSYYDDGGVLTQIKASEKTAARHLKGTPKPSELPDRMKGKTAAGNENPYAPEENGG